MCNGAVERRMTVTQAAESVKIGDHSRRTAAIRVLFAQQQTIRERRGPQGTHAIATIKSALWTTKWLTIVFPWPAQIHFPLQ